MVSFKPVVLCRRPPNNCMNRSARAASAVGYPSRFARRRPVMQSVRRLVAVLAVGGLPECKPSWLIPSLQMWRKALSLSEGYVPREQVGSSKPDSPAAAETSSPCDSLATGASRMAETDTRGSRERRWYPVAGARR